MDEVGFWQLIDESRAAGGGDIDRQCTVLEDRVARLSGSEIVEWDEYFFAWEQALHLEKLWGVAYVFNGGCSDDGFDYFKRWVMAHGRAVAVAARADPESLAPLLVASDGETEAELLAVAWNAHRRATGRELPVDGAKTPKDLGLPPVADWEEGAVDFDGDEMEQLLPKIVAISDW